MFSFIKKMARNVYSALHGAIRLMAPDFIMDRLNVESYSNRKLVEFASKYTKDSDRVLDVGAGNCNYKPYFDHARYEATDINENLSHLYEFISSAEDIPVEDESYDVVLVTHVLQHIENPQKAVDEFYRILKPGGKLFMSVPQGWGLYGEPNPNLFNFTSAGLKLLFDRAGFNIKFIKPRGGYFWYLGNRVWRLSPHIIFQYVEKDDDSISFHPLFFVLYPFYLISLPFARFLIPLLCFYLDKLDREKRFTLGYSCYCVKPKEGK